MTTNKNITDDDLKFLRQAIELAKEAEKEGNLPIGAVITLGKDKIAEGKNSIRSTTYKPDRHAEIVAIENVPSDKWQYYEKITLYTTLEPCLMCLGRILIHRIGRIVFGSNDPHGGAVCVFGHMPYAFEHILKSTTWVGPALPEECQELSNKVIEMALRIAKEEKKWAYPSVLHFDDPQFNASEFKQSLNVRNKKDE